MNTYLASGSQQCLPCQLGYFSDGTTASCTKCTWPRGQAIRLCLTICVVVRTVVKRAVYFGVSRWCDNGGSSAVQQQLSSGVRLGDVGCDGVHGVWERDV